MSISFVNKTTTVTGSGSLHQLSYAPTAGNTLLVGVMVGPEVETVSAIFDDAGLDIFGNPLNTWQCLGTISLNNSRMELWGCCPVVTPGTKVSIQLTGSVTNFGAFVAEYSGVATFGAFGSVSNQGYNNLFFTGTAQNNTNILFTMFGVNPNDTIQSGSGNVPPQNVPITPATQRLSGGAGTTGNFLGLEQTVISKEELVAEVVSQFIPDGGLMALGVVLNGGLVLSSTTGSAPGFSDINVDAIQAGTPGSPDPTKTVHAMTLAQIASNAALGMVRPEFFYGVYQDGDTVIEPISPVDSYQYQRDELIYIYTPLTTFDPASGWTTGNGILFYCMWDVDPDTGKVTSSECYHPDGSSPINKTSDGQLIVLTVAQRARSGIVMSSLPSLSNVDLTLDATDKPLTQSGLRVMAQNSKFGAVKAEVFYMGEAVDGQTIAPPTSDIDGYQYDYSEVKFISSWLWTSAQGGFSPPPQGAHGGWSQLQRLEASVSSTGVVHCASFYFNNIEIDPSQPGNGGVPYGRLRVYAFCQRKKGPALAIAQPTSTESPDATTRSYVAIIQGAKLIGKAIGNLTVSVKVGGAGASVSKIVILHALAGTDTILGSTTLYSGGTLAANSTFTTSPVSFTLDPANDYYVVMVVTNGNMFFTDITGLLIDSPVISGNKVTGDVSGATTVSSMSLTTVPPPTLARAWSAIQLTITGDTAAPGFADIPINAFVPGQPVPASIISRLAKNVKTSAYAIEFFGPTTHVQGDTISLPTSPVDGYNYSRAELVYIWQWKTTGSPEPRLWGYGGSIGANGVVNLMSWHVPAGGPIQNDTTGAQIDVITIGVRSQITAATTNNPGTNNGTPPPDLGSVEIGGTGGFVINGGS